MRQKSDNKRLYDIATRIALFVEGVKLFQSLQFNAVLHDVAETLTKLLGRVRYSTLDGLTKVQLNNLILDLRKSQSKIYSDYSAILLEQLKEFMQADLQINRRAWVSTFTNSDEIYNDEDAIKFLAEENNSPQIPLYGVAAISGSDDRLWSQISTLPIPANGLYLLPFIKTFSTSAQASVENVIRKAWANKLTIDETLKQLIGDGKRSQSAAPQLAKINQQATAVIHTVMAHIAAVVSVAVMSAVYSKYGWYSVIDGQTTEICIDRNGKVYIFGNGPIPPAHIRCRSHIAPVILGSDVDNETFYTWIARQPAAIQDEALGIDGGDALRKGTLKAKDLPKYEINVPLSFAAFLKKIKQILTD